MCEVCVSGMCFIIFQEATSEKILSKVKSEILILSQYHISIYRYIAEVHASQC